MTIYRENQINKLGLVNPGIYVIEKLPDNQLVGVPTNTQALVGVASWGPIGGVQGFSTLDSGVGKFGPPQVRNFDLMTHAAAGFTQGKAVSYIGTRVSDGTDVSAVANVPGAGTFVAKYTGTRGNLIQVYTQSSTKVGTMAVVITIPGRNPERFDNIVSTTPAIFWANVVSAINSGTPLRGPSQYLVFSAASTPTLVPVAGVEYSLTGGTDGDQGVSTAQMIGVDVRPRTGMYSLRGSQCDGFNLCDLTDSSTWPTQIAFGISEGMVAITSTASGDTIANAVATRVAQGADDPSLWLIVGDWPSFYDSYNGLTRLVSPQAFGSGLLGNLAPNQSPINKGLVGVVGTQTSSQGILTDSADEAVAQVGGVDFIGRSDALNVDYFTFMTGRNTSSNTQANGIEFTRMENFIARSLDSLATTQLVGLLQSRQTVDPTRIRAEAYLNSFGAQMKDPASGDGLYGLIEDYASLCDKTINSDQSISQGILQAVFKAAFLSVVRYFIIDLQGGNNVNITISPTFEGL